MELKEKLQILVEYIRLINKERKHEALASGYFIVLHNFLIVEEMFQADVDLCGKQINANLALERLNNIDDVLAKFIELYDVYHPVRNNVETLTNIEPIRVYLRNKLWVYTKLMDRLYH